MQNRGAVKRTIKLIKVGDVESIISEIKDHCASWGYITYQGSEEGLPDPEAIITVIKEGTQITLLSSICKDKTVINGKNAEELVVATAKALFDMLVASHLDGNKES